jgi:hypothetical protein
MNGLQSVTATSSTLEQMYPSAQRSHTSPQWSGVVLLRDLSRWQIEAVRKLFQLLALPRDWDSYGSPPPSEVAITAGVRLILGIDLDNFVSPRVVPVSGGGVQLEWSLGTSEVEIEIDNEGSAEYLKSSKGKPIEEGPISLGDLTEMRSLLTWLMT